MSDATTPKKVVSSIWYLLPILLGIIGGLIAWAVTKDDDPVKAKKFLILGIIFVVVEVVIVIAFFAASLGTMMMYT